MVQKVNINQEIEIGWEFMSKSISEEKDTLIERMQELRAKYDRLLGIVLGSQSNSLIYFLYELYSALALMECKSQQRSQ
jgi:hypothetical protein